MIRVHKTLGYGIRNFATPSTWEDTMEQVYDTPIKDFGKWLKANVDLVCSETRQGRRLTDLYLFEALAKEIPKKSARGHRVGNYIVKDDEFGIEGVLQLIPPGYWNWNRTDDTIDYYEESLRQPPCEPRFVELPHGVYPFDEKEIPLAVRGLAHYLGIPGIIPGLKASLYCYWA